MNKEEILAKSRQENQNQDLYELEIMRKAQRIGGLIAICIAFGLMFAERVILDTGTNYGYFLIILSACAGVWVYKAAKLKKRREIIWAAVWCAMTVYAAAMAVLSYI